MEYIILNIFHLKRKTEANKTIIRIHKITTANDVQAIFF